MSPLLFILLTASRIFCVGVSTWSTIGHVIRLTERCIADQRRPNNREMLLLTLILTALMLSAKMLVP
jgi:hypothetical protein